MAIAFGTFQDAYLYHLDAATNDPLFRNAPRGHASRELLGAAFTLGDPRQRLVTVPARRTNVIFNFAEALWYLAGRDDVAFPACYAPSIATYSADGVTLCGTAYGPRIFQYGPEGIDQWRSVIDTLAGDPDSKRAVVQIFDPIELRDPGNIDVACTLALQFLVRDGALHCVGYMRANDAYRGIVSDVFSFTLIQEMLATMLGLELGSYTHCVGSLHVYEPDVPRARAVLADAAAGATGAAYPFPAMPPGDNWASVRAVLDWEQRLRTNQARLSAAELAGLELPRYWREVVALFELHRQIRTGQDPDLDTAAALDPALRECMANRWPQYCGQPVR
jgi:thymidylate synthase